MSLRISECKLSDRLQQQEMAFVQMTLLQTLFCTMASNSFETDLRGWKEYATTETGLIDVVAWIDSIVSAVGINGLEANPAMRNESLDWSVRTAAAMRVASSNEVGPEELFQAHIFLVCFVRQQPVKPECISRLCVLVEQGWRRVVNFKATLRAPKVNVPAILEACALPDGGLSKVGAILLAASRVISLRVPGGVLADLKKLYART